MGLNEDSYYHADELLKKYFKEDDHPNITKIYHRVTLLNSFYSTRMGQQWCWKVAERLWSIRDEFNNRIFIDEKDNKIKLIRKLAEEYKYIDSSEKNRTFRPYSFITKYCSIYTFG